MSEAVASATGQRHKEILGWPARRTHIKQGGESRARRLENVSKFKFAISKAFILLDFLFPPCREVRILELLLMVFQYMQYFNA